MGGGVEGGEWCGDLRFVGHVVWSVGVEGLWVGGLGVGVRGSRVGGDLGQGV